MSTQPQDVLPVFPTGAEIVVQERWRGRLWSAIPHRVVSSEPYRLVSQVSAGTRGVFATNWGLPEAEGLTRDQRKHEALKTGVARPVEAVEPLDLVYVIEPGRWSRVNLAWDPAATQAFLGWYVNFELPVTGTETGT